MSTEWYIGFDNQVVGPVDQQQLLDFLKSSEQWRQILVWHTGLDEWKLAKDVPDVAALVSKGPPPLPAPPKPEAPSIVPAAPAEAKSEETKSGDAKPAEAVAAPVEAIVAPAPELIVAPAMPVSPSVAAAVAATPAKPARRWGWGATAATIALLLAGAFVAQQLGRRDNSTVAKATQPSSDAIIERGFAEIVQNTTLPKKLDDWTTRFDVTPASKRLVFHHILDTTRYLVPQNFSAAMKQKILPEVCTTAAREVLKAGGTLEYRFHTQAAFLIGSFEVSGNDCGGDAPKG